MKTLLQTVLGLIVGAILGGLVGYGVGELAVELFDISCFEGGCGYAVLLFILLGGLIGAAMGGVLSFVWRGSNSTLSHWLYTLAGALLLGYLAARLILAGSARLLVTLLNNNTLDVATIDLILLAYNTVFTYGVILACVIGSGALVYRWVSARRGVAAVDSGG